MLKCNNLSYQYTNNDPIIFPDFSLDSEEQATIIGPSGAGKTTLLHLLAGMLKPKEELSK